MIIPISNKNLTSTQTATLTVLYQPNFNHTLTKVTTDLFTVIDKQYLSTEWIKHYVNMMQLY